MHSIKNSYTHSSNLTLNALLNIVTQTQSNSVDMMLYWTQFILNREYSKFGFALNMQLSIMYFYYIYLFKNLLIALYQSFYPP